MKWRNLLLLFPLFAHTFSPAMAFVRARSVYGTKIYWESTQKSIYVNTLNENAMSAESIVDIAKDSLQEWKGQSNLSFNLVESSQRSNDQRIDIYFSKDFGLSTNVLAFTSLSYDLKTGKIVTADIIINDRKSYTSDSESEEEYYLGDVLTHEIGHLLGLDHSQVRDSTMLYQNFAGQSTLAEDDILGIKSIYPKEPKKGSISGTIVGSSLLVGILGAHVQLVSYNKNKIVAGFFTEGEGSFLFNDLDLNDTYYIYVRPVKISASVPEYFLTAKKNFCSNNDYRGGFFSKCGSRSQGYPYPLTLSSTQTQIQLENISIQCHLPLPSDYLANKIDEESFELELEFVEGDNYAFGNTFVGSFTEEEVEKNPDADTLSFSDSTVVTLEHIPNNGKNYFLDLRIQSQDFYSLWNFDVNVFNESNRRVGTLISEDEDSDGNPQINKILRIPLVASTAQTFNIKIYPYKIASDEMNDYFPSYVDFSDPLYFYLLMASVVEQQSDGSFIKYKWREPTPYPSNNICPEAPNTLKVSPFINKVEISLAHQNSTKKKAQDSGGSFACGTIVDGRSDDDDSPGSGVFLMSLSFMLIIMFVAPMVRFIKMRFF